MKFIPWAFGLIILSGILASLIIASGGDIDVINPTGDIAMQQKNLLYFAVTLSLLVIIPVFSITIFIGHKYRVEKKSKYKPNEDSNIKAETIWWAIPIILIFILSVVTWFTTYSLDPYKPINARAEPITVQVISLNYKWLFIYPDYDIASVNELIIPLERPVNFVITADSPMTSLWIPSLGSQIYAMKGMQTKLHLISNKEGLVDGKNSNISGEGYADMSFKVITTNETQFEDWAMAIKQNGKNLDINEYQQLTKYSVEEKPIYYTNIESRLFYLVIDKYANHGTH